MGLSRPEPYPATGIALVNGSNTIVRGVISTHDACIAERIRGRRPRAFQRFERFFNVDRQTIVLGCATSRGVVLKSRGVYRTNTLLDVRDLGRRKAGDADWLVRQVSFKIHSHDRLAILGASGAGKTVLLRLLALLDSPDQGEIRFRGHSVRDRDVPGYRRQVIYLHQRPYLFDGSVQQNLERPFHLQSNRGRRFDRAWIGDVLDRLGKSPLFHRQSTQNLSGGEAQIVALLRAIQLEPLILLLDEPTASADPEMALAIEQLLMDWFAADTERAMVCVTHRADQVRRLADRSLRIENGRIEGGDAD